MIGAYALRFRPRFELLDLPAREAVLRLLVEALAIANASYLRRRPDAPWLYASGVTFAEDAPGGRSSGQTSPRPSSAA